MLTGSLMDYALPRAEQSLAFKTEFDTWIPCLTNPLGVKGVGELGTIGATPAVVNAVIDALDHAGLGRAAERIQMPLTAPGLARARPRLRSVAVRKKTDLRGAATDAARPEWAIGGLRPARRAGGLPCLLRRRHSQETQMSADKSRNRRRPPASAKLLAKSEKKASESQPKSYDERNETEKVVRVNPTDPNSDDAIKGLDPKQKPTALPAVGLILAGPRESPFFARASQARTMGHAPARRRSPFERP